VALGWINLKYGLERTFRYFFIFQHASLLLRYGDIVLCSVYLLFAPIVDSIDAVCKTAVLA